MSLAIPIGLRLAKLYVDQGVSEMSLPYPFCQGCRSLETSWDMETHIIVATIQQCCVYDLVALGGTPNTYPPEVDLSLGLTRKSGEGPHLMPLTEWSIRLAFDDDDDDEGDWWGRVMHAHSFPLIARYINISVNRLPHLVIRELLVGTPHRDCLAEVD